MLRVGCDAGRRWLDLASRSGALWLGLDRLPLMRGFGLPGGATLARRLLFCHLC